MAAIDPHHHPKPRRIPTPGLIAALLLLAAAIAGYAWWWRALDETGQPEQQQQAQLNALLERRERLTAELVAATAAATAECPPGLLRQARAGAPDTQASPARPPAAETAAPQALPPPSPATGSVKVLSDSALADRLEKATVMVLVPGPEGKGLGTGTGFFIAPDLLITNRHVVEGATQGVLLVSSALRSVRRASVLRVTSESGAGSPDFALLRLDDGSAPGVLAPTTEVSKLASVVAAGFPGVVVGQDPRFRRLLAGDLSAAPDLSLTQGAVQSLQNGVGGMPLIVHTASIAKGNSGGPLVDACGRLVGVNTFISVDQTQSSKINYAIRSAVMQAFLHSSGSAAKADERTCSRP